MDSLLPEESREVTLLDLVDRAVGHGVVLAGDITISVADVDLIYLGLRALLTSVERAGELGAPPSLLGPPGPSND
jgi:gas vesicle structural protein